MKRLAIIVVMVLMSLTASASSIRYFTYGQAQRTVSYLNAQNEMVIFCGYDYEIETYILINEVWMERVNSAYYELWVYGYDAYTGDEIYMPIDLKCVWLYSAGRLYSAAQYLRFHTPVSTPRFTWYVPPYRPFTRTMHRPGYTRTYHYHVHCHGWMPPAPPRGGWGPHTQPPLPPYYMRTPQSPAPMPSAAWTPGVEHPQVSNSGSRSGSGTISNERNVNGNSPSPRPSSLGDRSSGTATTGSRGTATTGSRSGDNGNTTGTRSGNNDSGSRSSATTGSRSGESASDKPSRASESSTSGTRSTANTPTRANTGARSNENASSGDRNGKSSSASTPRSSSSTTGSRGGKSTSTGTSTSTPRSGSATTTGSRGGKSTSTGTSTSTPRSGSATTGERGGRR